MNAYDHDVWLTAQQAADRLGVSRPRVYQFIDGGRLQATENSLGLLVKADSVEELRRQREELKNRGALVATP